MHRAHTPQALLGTGRALLVAGIVLRTLIIWLFYVGVRDFFAGLQDVPPGMRHFVVPMADLFVLMAVTHVLALVFGVAAFVAVRRGRVRLAVWLSFLAAGCGALDLLFLLAGTCLWLGDPRGQVATSASAVPDGNAFP